MARPLTKKSEVVNAALILFMKNGIKATTTRDIALQAGVSEGTIYRHFESKDELARIIFEQNLDVFWKFLKKAFVKASTADELLINFVKGIFEFSRRYQRRYSFVMAAHQTELRKQSRQKMLPKKMLAKILRLGQKQGLFLPIEVNLAASMVLGTVTQTIFYLKSGQIAVSYDEVVDEVARACLRMVKKEVQ